MDSDRFKRLVAPYLTASIDRMGGIDRVRMLSRELPEQTIYFVAGVTFGLIDTGTVNEARPHFGLDSHEEMRRLLDLVRLRLETESSTS
jgi:hypothetical protein